MKHGTRNKIEKLKTSLRPFEFHDRLKDWLERPPASLGEAEFFYLKNFGIYGHKLKENRFVLRIRIRGGRLMRKSLEELYAYDSIGTRRWVVTSRAQMEVHDLSLQEAIKLHFHLEKIGLTSWQTFTDNFRNIVTHPLTGLSEDAVIDTMPIIEAMETFFLKNPDYTGMIPRKFNTAVIGNRSQLFAAFGNDLLFALAEREGEFGFNIYAGGKNSAPARSLDVFVSPQEVSAFFRAVAEHYLADGPRGSRSKVRLFNMIEEAGIEAYKEAILARYGRPVSGAGRLLLEPVAPQATWRLKEGGFAHRYDTRCGELDEGEIEEILTLCERFGVDEVRLGCDQHLYIPDLPEEAPWRKKRCTPGVLGCVGSRYCVYSLTDTKEVLRWDIWQECARLGIGVGFSGCLKGCARHAFSDIGLVGIRTKLFADEVERGARLYLGADADRGAALGRLVLYGVPLRSLPALVETLITLYRAGGHCRFTDFAREDLNRFDDAALGFWLLMNHYLRLNGVQTLVPLPKTDRRADACFREAAEKHLREAPETVFRSIDEGVEYPYREAIAYLERACFAQN